MDFSPADQLIGRQVLISAGYRLMQVNLRSNADRIIVPTRIPIVTDQLAMWSFFIAQTSSGWHLNDSNQIDPSQRPEVSSSKSHHGEGNMTVCMSIRKRFVAATALSLIAAPALAQNASDTEMNGHHYQGGPKTVVPHHMGKKEAGTVGVATKAQGTGGHHYRGGPATSVPHHMGDKQQ